MIKQLLEPRCKAFNAEVPSGALINLYDEDAVLQAENSPEFRERIKKVRTRKDKQAATNKWAKNVKINLMDNIELLALAESLDTEDGQTLVAFIRHHFCNYEKLMDACDNRFGGKEAKRIVRLRVLKMIAKTYPGLRPGCKRQWFKWYRSEMDF
jgi:hypothetical protein